MCSITTASVIAILKRINTIYCDCWSFCFCQSVKTSPASLPLVAPDHDDNDHVNRHVEILDPAHDLDDFLAVDDASKTMRDVKISATVHDKNALPTSAAALQTTRDVKISGPVCDDDFPFADAACKATRDVKISGPVHDQDDLPTPDTVPKISRDVVSNLEPIEESLYEVYYEQRKNWMASGY
ncbi:hypothetical protein SMACR_08802 [Sordaria macrospora]|uniref:WGS project CABT00000000 data, contig 2.15 n=2 Tax=Sordaria macrospora TaxID=5147 RepID=F7VZN9_SORMK|nr:uncharacterized protein SMAC_08802 [Sordaria macrospora k-hell]KAA8628731.1 hypothetical protein SMACR_08802 [Sordaria macrospora]KAH7636067.1 hypothetical protein B0T09DRAFT_391007 [Sordaria sp. MPI-SDFR-AT-0083]WPJ64517.1 hypothetical protein SMAC4_08802 [Sordaria macrospora]CCC10988.1 unnamed protein product [Sordaria macrospora k-hell]